MAKSRFSKTALDLLQEDENRAARIAALTPAVEARTGTSGLKSPEGWLFDAVGGGLSATGLRVGPDTAFNVVTYYACVDIVSKLVAMLPLRLMQKTDSGPVEVTNHQAAWLLRDRPNNFQTPFEFKRYLMASAAARGNGYARVYRNGYYEPTEVVPIHPAELEPYWISNLRTVVYKGRAAEDNGGQLLCSDVIHIKALSTDGVGGLSPLRVMRESLGLSLAYQRHTGATFAHGARMPGFFTTKGDVVYTAEQMALIRATYEQTYGGPDNSAKPRMLNGLSWQNIGMNNEDAELLASRKFEVEEIARFFGIPLHLLQSTEKGTTWGSGIEQMNRGTVDYMLTPWIVNLEQALNNVLLSEDERRVKQFYFKVSVQALLRGDPAARAAFYKTLTELRSITANQICDFEDLPRIPDKWADDPLTPMNGQGGGQAKPAAAESTPKLEPAAT